MGPGDQIPVGALRQLTDITRLAPVFLHRSVSGALSQRAPEDPGGDGSGEERAHLPRSHLLV